MLDNICLICSNPNLETECFDDGNTTTIRSSSAINQFFKLLERYLDETTFGSEIKDRRNSWRVLGKIIKDGIITCKDCSKIVETFSQLHRQMEKFQLLLNRQVQILGEKMSSLDPMNNFQRKSHVKMETEIFNTIVDCKRGIAKRCQQKVKASFPRLKLVNIDKVKEERAHPLTMHSNEEQMWNIDTGSETSPVADCKPKLEDIDVSKDYDSDPDYEVKDFQQMDHPPKFEDSHVKIEEQSRLEIEGDTNEPTHDTTNDARELEIKETLPRSTFNPDTFRHRCRHCKKEFLDRDSVSRHFKCVHSKVKKNHRCTTCGKGFMLRFQYNNHCKIVHAQGPIKCNVCGETFEQKSKFRRHQQSHRKKEKVQAAPVPTTSQIPKGITDPLTGKISCTKCPKVFQSNRGFGLHYSSEHLCQRFICPICDQSYKSKLAYSRHHDIVHAGKRFTCEACSKSFTEKNKLRVHKLHCGTGVPKVTQYAKCQICGKEVTRSALRHHMKYVHSNKRNHLCSHCGKAFVSSGDLRKHVKNVHLQLREHMCDLCGKGFITNSNLRIHRRKLHSITG